MSIRPLSQNQMAEEIAARMQNAGWQIEFSDPANEKVRYNDVDCVKEVLAHLHETILDEIEEGIPVNVVNVARLSVRYSPAKPKRWVYSPATNDEVLANARPAKLTVKARATTTVQASAPSTRSTVGKRIAKVATARAKKRERAAKARERAAA